MDIRCRKTNCQFNNKFTCQAKEILINQKIICSTYKNGDKPEIDTTKTMFERAPEYAPQRDSKTMKIGCKTNCMFNKSGVCIANGITVNDIKECPYCMTYISK